MSTSAHFVKLHINIENIKSVFMIRDFKNYYMFPVEVYITVISVGS